MDLCACAFRSRWLLVVSPWERHPDVVLARYHYEFCHVDPRALSFGTALKSATDPHQSVRKQ